MKRLSPLPEHERCTVTGWLDKCENGFYECKTCLHVVDVETRTDPTDDSRTFQVCVRCGSYHVVWRPPVFSR